MTSFEANLRALGLRDPGLADRLAPLGGSPDRGQWSLARSGDPTVRRDGVAWASAFDPAAEARRAVPAWGPEADFAVVVGLGPGYLAEAASAAHPDLPLVICEADLEWFAEVLRHRDLSALWARAFVVVLAGPDPEALGRFLGAYPCHRVEVLEWRPLAPALGPWPALWSSQVAQAQARAQVNPATLERFGALWGRNLARNRGRGRGLRPLTALEGRGRGRPAVVAAAGPSLADALGWIQAHRSQCLLLAVDTAWPALAARGLAPDVLLVLDGQYWNGRHVDLPPPETTLVVTEWIAPPRAFDLAPGRTFVAATSLPLWRRAEEALWGPLGALPSGGSVATAAWSLALVLGCSEVAFAGLDLAYPRGQTHVPGSQFEEALHRSAHRLAPAETRGLGLAPGALRTQVPCLAGGLVPSDLRMDLFRAWLADSVRAHPEVRAVNLGTRGSLVPGLEAAPAGYGDRWAPAGPLNPAPGPLLEARGAAREAPPRAALADLGGATDSESFERTLTALNGQARAYWGSEVWDRWTAREAAAWARFPSPRTQRSWQRAARLALAWVELRPEV